MAITALAEPPVYVLEPLGTLGGEHSKALAVSNLGTVVGWAETGDPVYERHAFLWKGEFMQDLRTLGGTWSEARAVNDFGEVVGVSAMPDGGTHGFYLHRKYIRDLDKLIWEPADDMTQWSLREGSIPKRAYTIHTVLEANGINNLGEIVICATVVEEPGEIHGFLLEPLPKCGNDPGPPMFDYRHLGRLHRAPDCIPQGLNQLGEVVGSSGQAAFRWDGQAMSPLENNHPRSQGNAINVTGEVAGWAGPTVAESTACIWTGTYRVDLGVPLFPEMGDTPCWSKALDMNDWGQVVGCAAAPNCAPVAMLWDGYCLPFDINGLPIFNVHDLPRDLNKITGAPPPKSPALWLEEATAINEEHQIVGFGRTFDGRMQAFLLSRVDGGAGDMRD
jgi:probable HAF family extracellular repeat protein